MTTQQPVIGMLRPESVPPAAQLLAASMRDNPLHQRVFDCSDAQLEPMLARAFEHLLRKQMRIGIVLAACQGDRLVGVAAMVPPGFCQPGLQDKLVMLPVLARGRVLRRLPRIYRWLRTWAQQEPAFDHWHLGPAAVHREHQGRGIGSLLMAAICHRLDECQGTGYLETDKPRNVQLYRRGGFEVIAEQPVLGVTNWFMVRPPR